MFEILLFILLIVSLIQLILLFILFKAKDNKKSSQLEAQFMALEKGQDKLERSLKDDAFKARQESNNNSRTSREEINNFLKTFSDTLTSHITDIATFQKSQLDVFSNQISTLTQMNEQKLEKIREIVEEKLTTLREDNNQKLEQMRLTVDEKLHNTLEQRLGDSFKIVSERLELVHKGLGEMQTLASGVGDLKKVLTNVKTRGTWGEIQLGSLLEQVLTNEQYCANISTKKDSNDRVEFAIKLPGNNGNKSEVVWLPIDAKFPMEDYQKLFEAHESFDSVGAEEAAKKLEQRIKAEAKTIMDKYIDPPNTTDFAIMFLPTEGLYADVLRRPGLSDILQREYRIVIAGPTTLAALLNSLQMGFRTLTVEKRSSEVWTLLGAVKTEFGKFGDILDKTQKKLQEASNTIETASKKTRGIEKKLKKVQELPSLEATEMLVDIETESDSEDFVIANN